MQGVFASHSPQETFELGRKFAATLSPNSVVALNGDLGAGKTVLIRGICDYFGVSQVTSPTYTLLNEYPSPALPLFHFDLYRLSEEEELEQIGFWDTLGAGGVVLVEWAERFPFLFQDLKAITVSIQKDPAFLSDERSIEIS